MRKIRKKTPLKLKEISSARVWAVVTKYVNLVEAHGKNKNAHLQNNGYFQRSDSGLQGNEAFQESLSEWFFYLLGFSTGKPGITFA